MSNQISEAERAMVALFDGLTRMQRMALLARFEAAGGGLYRALAADEKNVKARRNSSRPRPTKRKMAGCCA